MESGHIPPQFREHFLDQLVKTFESAKHWQPPVKSLKGNQDGTSNTAEVTSSDAKSVSSPEQEKEEKVSFCFLRSILLIWGRVKVTL